MVASTEPLVKARRVELLLACAARDLFGKLRIVTLVLEQTSANDFERSQKFCAQIL